MLLAAQALLELTSDDSKVVAVLCKYWDLRYSEGESIVREALETKKKSKDRK